MSDPFKFCRTRGRQWIPAAVVAAVFFFLAVVQIARAEEPPTCAAIEAVYDATRGLVAELKEDDERFDMAVCSHDEAFWEAYRRCMVVHFLEST